MVEMVNIGILGTGFGREHLRLFCQIPECRVVKVFGRDKSKLEQIQKEHQVDVTLDPLEVIESPHIDLIDVCLPTRLHVEYIHKSLSNNKNVFCEMPLCETEEDLEAIDINAQNRVSVSAFLKYFVEYEYLARIIRDNEFGKVKAVTFKRYTPPIWGHLGFENIVLSFMFHEIDYAAWVFGAPVTVEMVHAFEKEHQSYVHAMLKYPDLAINLQASSFLPASYPLTIGYEAFFEEGYLEFTCGFEGEQIVKRLVRYTKNQAEEIQLAGIYPYEAMLKDLVFCEANQTKSRMDIEIAKTASKTAFAIKHQIAASR